MLPAPGGTKRSFSQARIATWKHAGAPQICRMVISPARGLRSSISCVEKLSHHRGRLLHNVQSDNMHHAIGQVAAQHGVLTAVGLLNSHYGQRAGLGTIDCRHVHSLELASEQLQVPALTQAQQMPAMQDMSGTHNHEGTSNPAQAQQKREPEDGMHSLPVEVQLLSNHCEACRLTQVQASPADDVPCVDHVDEPLPQVWQLLSHLLHIGLALKGGPSMSQEACASCWVVGQAIGRLSSALQQSSL